MMACVVRSVVPAVAGVVLLVLVLESVLVVVVEASNKGGAPCSVNVQCGWPAANVDSLREGAASITGQCLDGKCECYSFYGCQRCTVVESSGSGTVVTNLNDESDTFDLCDFSWGGGVCTQDDHCGNGLCIDNRCVCYANWACNYCTLDRSQDIMNGAKCGQYVSGYGACSTDNECNSPFGVCRNGKCQCGSGYACSHCTGLISQLLDGSATCTCNGVDCHGHGACHNGACVCNDGYTGRDCSFDPCEDKTCAGHGQCSRETGKCVCDEGYGGEDCSTGGGSCDEDKHCGVFGTNQYGGYCDDAGECQCFEGYTCNDCAGIGDECAEATGGGVCESDFDCGNFGGKFGGKCVFTDTDKYWITTGKCRCWPGFTCGQCDVSTSDHDAGVKCPARNAGARVQHSVLLAVIVGAVAMAVRSVESCA